MPVPGPRTQARPLPGYDNPGGEQPHRLNRWGRPDPVVEVGRTPGIMFVSRRGSLLAPGTVRRLWRQSIDLILPQAPFSWTSNGNDYRPPRGVGITTAIRYMTRSVYVQGGTDNSRISALHTKIEPRVHSKPVTTPAGNVRNRPTIRNRITSFGSRVPPLNRRVTGSAT